MSPGPSVQMAQAVPQQVFITQGITTTLVQGPSSDIQDYEGMALFLVTVGALGGAFTTLQVEHSDTSGGTYVAIPLPVGGVSAMSVANWVPSTIVANAVYYVTAQVSELKRFVRFAVQNGTSATVGCTMIGFKKYRP